MGVCVGVNMCVNWQLVIWQKGSKHMQIVCPLREITVNRHLRMK